jgi:hypothetical protein
MVLAKNTLVCLCCREAGIGFWRLVHILALQVKHGRVRNIEFDKGSVHAQLVFRTSEAGFQDVGGVQGRFFNFAFVWQCAAESSDLIERCTDDLRPRHDLLELCEYINALSVGP